MIEPPVVKVGSRWLCRRHETSITDPYCPECRSERRIAFGKRLHAARRVGTAEVVTLRRLGQQVRLTAGFLGTVERGEVEPPGENYIRLIARRLEVCEDEFLAHSGRIPHRVLEALRDPAFLQRVAAMIPEEVDRADVS